jgi:very-short-patch-repair endonuclease
MAAVLACRPDAVLSHWAAAALWGITRRDPRMVDVTTPRKLAGTAGIHTHFARLPFDEITIHDGIPTTTVPRTLADIAATATSQAFHRALEQAEILRLADPLSLNDVLKRDPRRRGARTIRQALETLDGQITKEELERRFRSFVEQHGLPAPRTNAIVEAGGRELEVDCLWEERRVIVELDGRETHFTTFAFERDRERDRVLAAAGYVVIRVTWRQLRDQPDLLRRDLEAVLARVRA